MVKLAIWGGGTPEIIHAVDNKAKMNCKSFIEESILHANSAREITPKLTRSEFLLRGPSNSYLCKRI